MECHDLRQEVWEIGGIAPHVLNLAARCKKSARFTPRPHFPVDDVRFTLSWQYVWPIAGPDAMKGNSLPLPKMKPLFSGSLARNIVFVLTELPSFTADRDWILQNGPY
jgi:hypothetical protein